MHVRRLDAGKGLSMVVEETAKYDDSNHCNMNENSIKKGLLNMRVHCNVF